MAWSHDPQGNCNNAYSQRKKKPVFPIFVLATLVLQAGILGLLILEFFLIARFNNRPAPSLVQLVDGRAIKVAPMDHLERHPETIRRFVNETLTLMFSWSGTLPPETVEEAKSPKVDPGVPLAADNPSSARVATTSWEASFALSEEFRRPFVEKLADLTPQTLFKGQGNQGLIVIRRISHPRPVDTGQWQVALVANLVLFSPTDQVGKAVPFNKEIYLRAIAPPTLPLEEKSSRLEQVIYRTRQAGLEIYAIRDLSKEDISF